METRLPRLSLCMIVKDEAAFIESCLESARDIVDEIVVVDTGSTDATVARAECAGARVFHFKWCDDFAAARNSSIACATGDWVLWLDADERLAPGAAPIIRQTVTRDDVDCGYLFLHNASRADAPLGEVISGRARLGSPILHPRLLRRTPDLRFVGVVHEQLDGWLTPRVASGRVCNLDAHLIHLGYAPELRQSRRKGERNIRLLEKRARLAPRDFTSHGYLAQEHFQLGEIEQAWEAADAGWRLFLSADPSSRQPALLLVCMRAQLQLARGESKGALQTIRMGRAWIGQHPDLDIFAGTALLAAALENRVPGARAAALQEADASYQAAIDRVDLAYSQAFLGGSLLASGQVGRGLVALASGEAAGALRYFDGALAREAGSREASLGRAEALVGVGRSSEALHAIEPWLDGSPDGWLIAAVAHEDLGDIDQLRSALAQARQRLPVGYSSPHRNEVHWALQSRLLAYYGQPKGGTGAFGAVCALLAGEAPGSRAPLTGPELGWTKMLVRNLSRLGQEQVLTRLLSTEAEEVGGLPALVRGSW